MISRRQALSAMGLTGAAAMLPLSGFAGTKKEKSNFRYCLNTSTISGQKPGVLKYIEVASEAGYDGVEIWVRDVKEYLEAGNSTSSLKQYIDDHQVKIENAIGFAPWLVEGEEAKKVGFQQMREEMEMLKEIGCDRIAAPPAGVPADKPLDLFYAGQRYRELLDLGRETGVMPLLEFWGPSPVLFHLGQALMIAAVADDPDCRILPDVYHLFRGDSGFEGLKMVNGQLIEIIHMNDFPSSKPREQQVDADRVYPGDGAAPLKQILTDLKAIGGTQVLSLELFNRDYWKEDPLFVAQTGIRKMKEQVAMVDQ